MRWITREWNGRACQFRASFRGEPRRGGRWKGDLFLAQISRKAGFQDLWRILFDVRVRRRFRYRYRLHSYWKLLNLWWLRPFLLRTSL